MNSPCPLGAASARPVTSAAPVEADSFWVRPIGDPVREAEAFLRQMAAEQDGVDLAARLSEMRDAFARTGRWDPSTGEVTYGARVAWRNSVRCVGRMFWPSLKVFDARDPRSPDQVFEAIRAHVRWSTNGGDLRPALTLFRAGEPRIRILNPQLILYAGYRRADGTVLGDPKNVWITEVARSLGWRGAGTRFDLLPLVLRFGEGTPVLYELPPDEVLEVELRHPEVGAFDRLGLRWFALPAVSGMALDLGGTLYPAAPSTGVYQGTEIGSVNLGDPRRYDQLPAVADALGLKQLVLDLYFSHYVYPE